MTVTIPTKGWTAIKEKKIEKFIEAIRDNRFVCDSIMRCKGWQGCEYRVLKQSFKFCPWCGEEIKWDIEP